MLYTVSCSPYQCDLQALSRMVIKGDDILLLQDGVIAAVKRSESIKSLLNAPAALFVLQVDVEARGLVDQISNQITVINYSQFVDLTVKHLQHMAW